jgi:membrane protease YdiL (CAAX protease family)
VSAQNPNTSSPARHDRNQVVLALAIAASGVALFAATAARVGASASAVALVSIVFAWVFIPCPALTVSHWAAGLRSWIARAPLLRGAALVILASVGPVAYAALLPIVPHALIALFPWRASLHLAIFQLAVALVPLEGVGLTFRLERRDGIAALMAFLAFALIGIPIGLGSGFIHWGWQRLAPLDLAALAFRIYFLIALPEELLFRGLLQNGVERRWFEGRRWPGSLAIASLIFGAAHLGHRPAPNWRYGLLATLAGVAYGSVWHRSRKITGSALTHCAVDLAWSVFFAG